MKGCSVLGWGGPGAEGAAWVCKGVAGFQYVSHTDSARGIFFEKDIRQILLKNMSVTCWQGPTVSQGAAGGGRGGWAEEEGTSGRREEPVRVRQCLRVPPGPARVPVSWSRSAVGTPGSPLVGGWGRVLETRP